MTVTEAARILFISATHLRDLVRRGEIAATRQSDGKTLDIDINSAMKWKQSSTASERKTRCGTAWRDGMVITPWRQWRCKECNKVNQHKYSRDKCMRCGADRAAGK